MCGVYKPTNVISISYGLQENALPVYYQKRQCNEYLKLGLQGTSIFLASGDTGVGGYPGGSLGAESYYGCLGPDDTVFSPTQPNSCPWVTNVGATKVYAGKTVFEPESAAYDPDPSFNYSSGGVSEDHLPFIYQARIQADNLLGLLQHLHRPYLPARFHLHLLQRPQPAVSLLLRRQLPQRHQRRGVQPQWARHP